MTALLVHEGTKLFCRECWEPVQWGLNCDYISCPRCGRESPAPAVKVVGFEPDPFESGSGDPVFLREVPDWVATELPEEIRRAQEEARARALAQQRLAEEEAKERARQLLGAQDLVAWFKTLPEERQQQALWEMDPYDGGFGSIDNFRDPEYMIARWIISKEEQQCA